METLKCTSLFLDLNSNQSPTRLFGAKKVGTSKAPLNQDKASNPKPLDINRGLVHKVDSPGVPSAESGIVTPVSPSGQSVLSKIKLTSKLNRLFWIGLGCWTTYNLIDSGLSRLLALETLTHGTGPLGYIGINLNGADPNFGGGKTGSSVGRGDLKHIENSKRYFHVFKDSAFSEICHNTPSRAFCYAFLYPLGNHLLPRYHAITSGMATFGHSRVRQTGNWASTALGAISGFLTPTLKFRFTPNEILNCTDPCLFENDPDYGRAAYRTSKLISASHLGIVGSLSQGINADMLNRMSANPGKVLWGAALLGAAALVARKTYHYYLKSASGQQLKSPENPEAQVNSPPSEKGSFFQNLRKKIKPIAAKSGWTTLAVTIIFLNTI